MAKKQAYVVLVGLKPGVYRHWLDVTQNVVGVPEAQYKGFTYWDEASEYFERAHSKGATRAVKKPPKDEDRPPTPRREYQGRRRGGSERQPRRRQDSSPAARSVQAPTPVSRGTSAGRAMRDAQIAAALADARKNRIGPSASSPSVMSGERKPSRHTALARSATEPAYHIQVQDPQAASTPRHPARRSRKLPSPEPALQRRSRTPDTKGSSGSIGPISDIPTDETQLRNRFTNSPGRSTPRYAQSLSYATDSSSLTSSDLRTHLSSPSSFGTRYFPEDWLARLERRRESADRGVRGDDRSSVLSTSVSEYATAPNTPEMKSVVLEDDVEDIQVVPNPSASTRSRVGRSEPASSRSSANVKARPKTWSSAMPPPATPTEVISSPSATSTPRRTRSTPDSVNDRCFSPSIASVPPSSSPSEPKKKRAKRVIRSLSEAEVQTDAPPQVRRRKNLEAGVQAVPPSVPKRQLLDNQVQTTPVASPLRASTGVGDVPVRPPPGGPLCACEHPEYACIHCGQRPRTERYTARSAAGRSRSSRTPPTSTPTSTTTESPAASEISSLALSPVPSAPASPASAVPSSVSTRSTRTRSSRSHIGGHTPLMGPSERTYTRSLTARIEASLGSMSFSEAAQGVAAAEAVVHDVSFDPRSPIQRGTRVPAGTSGSAVRPSPAMAPVPMGSLGLLFPS